MDRTLLFSLTFAAIAILSAGAIPSVVFEPQDLVIPDGESATFQVILISEDHNVSTTLSFGEENPSDLIKWDPPGVTLSKDGNISAIVTVNAKSPGHTVLQGINVQPQNRNIKGNEKKLLETSTTRMKDPKAAITADVENAFVRINIYRAGWLDVFNTVIGWVFAISSCLSFYPQLWANFRRRSVVGLQFDFAALNVHGFVCLSVFNIAMYWSPEIQIEYRARHLHGINPVQLSDVIFAAHAAITTLLVILQIFLYERGGQSLSKIGIGLLVTIYLFLGITLVLSFCGVIQWLDYMYFYSYVKLVITFVKYIPQVYFNYRRKSTAGYSLGNVFLDFFAGAIYLVQMLLIAYNFDDWGSIYGNLAKLGIGLFSVWFDSIFMVQHFILYRNPPDNSLTEDDTVKKEIPPPPYSEKEKSVIKAV